jgi:hypothetical protein
VDFRNVAMKAAPVAKVALDQASSPAESIYNLWPVCTFCGCQDGTVRS